MPNAEKPPQFLKGTKVRALNARVDVGTFDDVNAMGAMWARNQGEVLRAAVALLRAQLSPEERRLMDEIRRTRADSPPPRKPRAPKV
jgi:hypothetical protein